MIRYFDVLPLLLPSSLWFFLCGFVGFIVCCESGCVLVVFRLGAFCNRFDFRIIRVLP